MTAIYYPDCQATSFNGRFILEARSPHNGAILRRDGRPPSDDDFGFKYREHQSEFRYRLLDTEGGDARVVWERWQEGNEDSPHELVASDDGWGILRTHGFRPEVIAVSSDGRDVLRVRIAWPEGEQKAADESARTPVFDWSPDVYAFSTAGIYWAEHSWRFFFQHNGSPYFTWRRALGERLVIDLNGAVLFPEGPLPAELRSTLEAEEIATVSALLAAYSQRMEEVRRWFLPNSGEKPKDDPLVERLPQVVAALNLVGVHRLAECVPYLREWEGINCPAMSGGSFAMPDWWLQTQLFRPVVHHSLRLLGEEPLGYSAYHFTDLKDTYYPVPESLPDRYDRAAKVGLSWTAEEVLTLLGSPDFIKRCFTDMGNAKWQAHEEWEYDFRVSGRWTTLRLVWQRDDRPQGLAAIEEVAPYWLESPTREQELFQS